MSIGPVADRLPWDRCLQFAIPAYGVAVAAFAGAPRFQGGGVSITLASTLLYATSAISFAVAVRLTYLAVTRHPGYQRWSRRTGAIVIAVLLAFFVPAAMLSLTATWTPGLGAMARGGLWGAAVTLILVGVLLGVAGRLYLRRIAPEAEPAPERTDEERTTGQAPFPGAYDPAVSGFWSLRIPTWEDEAYREGRQQIEALRATRGLKPLSDFQEGLSASAVDPGTYAALAGGLHPPIRIFVGGNIPEDLGVQPGDVRLTQGADASSQFEVHYLRKGVVELVGFVTKQDAHTLRTCKVESPVSIFSRKTLDAPELITVDVNRIVSSTTHTIKRSATRMDVSLKPTT